METTDYSGMFVYKDDHIDYINTSEGRLKWDAHNHLFYAEYFIKDHLGNVRSVITSDPNQHFTLQGTDYYPFGLEIPVYGASDNQIKYNSKELQTEADLDWYDYGARFYDPVLARWHSVDPMAETSRRWSPYTYCMNNPIRFIDPDGMNVDWYEHKNENGSTTVIWQEGNASQKTIQGQTYDHTENGESYTLSVDDKASITYDQNEPSELTVTTNTEWISQYSKDDWGGTTASKACGKASDAMLGGKIDASSTTITENAGNGRAGIANSYADNAIKEMKNTLDNGTGVKVGVDFRDGSSEHLDKMGDHFIVVNGYTDKLNNGQVTSTSYRYLDPGTNHESKGAALSNQLITGNGRLVGTHINNGKPIVVTSIRRK
jgi:RHS repeat-associated protein